MMHNEYSRWAWLRWLIYSICDACRPWYSMHWSHKSVSALSTCSVPRTPDLVILNNKDNTNDYFTHGIINLADPGACARVSLTVSVVGMRITSLGSLGSWSTHKWMGPFIGIGKKNWLLYGPWASQIRHVCTCHTYLLGHELSAHALTCNWPSMLGNGLQQTLGSTTIPCFAAVESQMLDQYRYCMQGIYVLY